MATETRIKPSVGIIYSDNEIQSLESKNLALYFAALLASSGYSKIYLIGLTQESFGGAANNNRIYYVNPGTSLTKSTKPIEAPGSDISYESWSILSSCDLVILTVNACDSTKCVDQLERTLGNRAKTMNNKGRGDLNNVNTITIISLQRGIRNSGVMKDEIKERIATGVVVIEAVIGFGVITSVVDRREVLVPTVNCPFHSANALSIGIQRIAKEDIDIADKPLRLLEVLPGIMFFYRKTLTPLSWGVLLYELQYAVNTITGGSLADTLSNRHARLLFASLLRESRLALRTAARNGAWRPDFSLSCTSSATIWLTSSGHVDACWLLEMLLSAPDWLFNTTRLGLWYFNVPAGSSMDGSTGGANLVISPGQCDLLAARLTCNSHTLKEIIEAGERVNSSMLLTKSLAEGVSVAERAYAVECQRNPSSSVFTFNTQHVTAVVESYNASLATDVTAGRSAKPFGADLTAEFQKYSFFAMCIVMALLVGFYLFIELLFYEFEVDY